GVVRVEADPVVLDHLRQQEGQPEQEGEHHPGLEAGPVVALHRLRRPVHGETRGDEDDRVDERDEDGPLVRMRRPGMDVVDDPVEEVDREEGAEEHDLRPDEEEDADDRRRDPRAVVDRGRMQVRVAVAVAVGFGGRAHESPASGWLTTCSTGSPVSVFSRSIRSRRSQPDRACGKVETMISSIRSSWTAFVAAVNGSGSTTWPCASM